MATRKLPKKRLRHPSKLGMAASDAILAELEALPTPEAQWEMVERILEWAEDRGLP